MTIETLETPNGRGRLFVDVPTAPTRAVLLLGHGAGGGVEAFDLAALAAALPDEGIAVIRFEQPWRTAGRRVAGPPAGLDAAWRPALAWTTTAFPGVPLFVGGRSAGARVACRCFEEPASGVVALSFPLHPPGKPERSRAPELARVAARTLVIQGERDPFGSPDEVRAALAELGAAPSGLVTVPGAAHSFEPRSKAARGHAGVVAALIADAVGDWVCASLSR
jgi:predicted alpha/beta-hydrolase family hydrolase